MPVQFNFNNSKIELFLNKTLSHDFSHYFGINVSFNFAAMSIDNLNSKTRELTIDDFMPKGEFEKAITRDCKPHIGGRFATCITVTPNANYSYVRYGNMDTFLENNQMPVNMSNRLKMIFTDYDYHTCVLVVLKMGNKYLITTYKFAA